MERSASMAVPILSLSVFSDGSIQGANPAPRFSFAWDDQNPDWNYKCRTQFPGSTIKADNPPAVIRYYPEMREKAGDFRVDVSAWKQFVIDLNGGDAQKWGYWCGSARAQFNSTGWPQLAYVGMCGNEVRGTRVGDWFKFETLKPGDLSRAKGMTRKTHPWLVHTFTCVTWDRETKTTKHIWSTGTPRGVVDYPLITRDGFAFIPWRHVEAH